MGLNNYELEDEQKEVLDDKTKNVIDTLNRKIKVCNSVTGISAVILIVTFFRMQKHRIDLINATIFISAIIFLIASYADGNRFTNYLLKVMEQIDLDEY